LQLWLIFAAHKTEKGRLTQRRVFALAHRLDEAVKKIAVDFDIGGISFAMLNAI
jgi:hypothetical protein